MLTKHINKKKLNPIPEDGKESDKKRFWSKVKKTKKCWIWNSSKFTDGYGRFKIKIGGVYYSRRSHRLSYAWSVGLDNDRLVNGIVIHSCDNPLCVNPKHLSIGTVQDNIDDCIRKGRRVYSFGERNGMSKLTQKQVCDIRKSEKSGVYLSNKYNVSVAQVSRIRNRKRWK